MPSTSFALRARCVKDCTVERFSSQSWQLVVHTGFSLLEAYIIFFYEDDEVQWPRLWTNTRGAWSPHPLAGQQQPRILIWLYFAQLGVWTYLGFVHVLFDERRRDFYAMLLHHIVTVALVGAL